MAAGDSLPKLVVLSVALGPSAGDFLSYADKAAFQAAGWNLIAYDVDGVALTSQPTWAIAVVDSAAGEHRIKWTEPSGAGYFLLTKTNAYYRSDPYGWSFDGASYSIDDVMALLQINQGVPAITSAADGDLGDVVDGDSYRSAALTIPEGKLARFGYTYADLASPDWIFSVGVKHVPSDDGFAIDFIPGASIATDGAFSLGWDAMDTAMRLSDATDETSKQFFIDVQLINTVDDIVITTNRYAINNVWERDVSVEGP